MKIMFVKGRIVTLLGVLAIVGNLGACASGSPDYVGSIPSVTQHKEQQRTLDNGQINSIIKRLQSDAVKQKVIADSLTK